MYRPKNELSRVDKHTFHSLVWAHSLYEEYSSLDALGKFSISVMSVFYPDDTVAHLKKRMQTFTNEECEKENDLFLYYQPFFNTNNAKVITSHSLFLCLALLQLKLVLNDDEEAEKFVLRVAHQIYSCLLDECDKKSPCSIRLLDMFSNVCWSYELLTVMAYYEEFFFYIEMLTSMLSTFQRCRVDLPERTTDMFELTWQSDDRFHQYANLTNIHPLPFLKDWCFYMPDEEFVELMGPIKERLFKKLTVMFNDKEPKFLYYAGFPFKHIQLHNSVVRKKFELGNVDQEPEILSITDFDEYDLVFFITVGKMIFRWANVFMKGLIKNLNLTVLIFVYYSFCKIFEFNIVPDLGTILVFILFNTDFPKNNHRFELSNMSAMVNFEFLNDKLYNGISGRVLKFVLGILLFKCMKDSDPTIFRRTVSSNMAKRNYLQIMNHKNFIKTKFTNSYMKKIIAAVEKNVKNKKLTVELIPKWMYEWEKMEFKEIQRYESPCCDTLSFYNVYYNTFHLHYKRYLNIPSDINSRCFCFHCIKKSNSYIAHREVLNVFQGIFSTEKLVSLLTASVSKSKPNKSKKMGKKLSSGTCESCSQFTPEQPELRNITTQFPKRKQVSLSIVTATIVSSVESILISKELTDRDVYAPISIILSSDESHQRRLASFCYNQYSLAAQLGLTVVHPDEQLLNSVTCDSKLQLNLIMLFFFGPYYAFPMLVDRDNLRETLNKHKLFTLADAIDELTVSQLITFDFCDLNALNVGIPVVELLNRITKTYYSMFDVDITPLDFCVGTIEREEMSLRQAYPEMHVAYSILMPRFLLLRISMSNAESFEENFAYDDVLSLLYQELVANTAFERKFPISYAKSKPLKYSAK
ncbi:hypothetical protein PCE1_000162 [Barthelona sp. PCE]